MPKHIQAQRWQPAWVCHQQQICPHHGMGERAATACTSDVHAPWCVCVCAMCTLLQSAFAALMWLWGALLQCCLQSCGIGSAYFDVLLPLVPADIGVLLSTQRPLGNEASRSCGDRRCRAVEAGVPEQMRDGFTAKTAIARATDDLAPSAWWHCCWSWGVYRP